MTYTNYSMMERFVGLMLGDGDNDMASLADTINHIAFLHHTEPRVVLAELVADVDAELCDVRNQLEVALRKG